MLWLFMRADVGITERVYTGPECYQHMTFIASKRPLLMNWERNKDDDFGKSARSEYCFQT